MNNVNTETMNIKLQEKFLQLKIDRRNKTFLGLFLIFCLITLACKIVDGILLDIGLRDGKIHLGFWTDPHWLDNLTEGTPEYMAASAAIEHHPNTIWFITQFTWITTILIILFLSVRLFKYDGKAPRWLKWIMTQRTLSWVATFDTVVAIIFWSSMFNNFSKNFNGDLREFEITYTIFVHAIIPIFILIYAFIYLLFDKKASILRIKFIWKGMIYIFFYMSLYLILTIVWSDPYPVTHMHESLVKEGWTGWAKELWKICIAVLGVYLILGIMFITHNFVLINFNRKYITEEDYESLLNKDDLIQEYRDQVIADIVKSLAKKQKKSLKNKQ